MDTYSKMGWNICGLICLCEDCSGLFSFNLKHLYAFVDSHNFLSGKHFPSDQREVDTLKVSNFTVIYCRGVLCKVSIQKEKEGRGAEEEEEERKRKTRMHLNRAFALHWIQTLSFPAFSVHTQNLFGLGIPIAFTFLKLEKIYPNLFTLDASLWCSHRLSSPESSCGRKCCV